MCTSLTALLLFLGLWGLMAQQGIDYCDRKMCPRQGIHVACGKTMSFGEKCEGVPKLENVKPYIPMILDQHNHYRNLVASGKVNCFYPAVRMPMLLEDRTKEWDNDLAETAAYNAKSCVFAHDTCRSTKKFRMAGQNIYTATTRKINIPVEGFIQEAIFLWFEEQFDADYSVLESFRKTEPQTGHFTLLVNDRHTHVGCAFLNNFLPGPPERRLVIFTCNYSSTNFRGFPSYKPGPPGSQCQKRNAKFEALCEDRVDPDDVLWYNTTQSN